MKIKNKDSKIILACNRQGIVQEIFLDTCNLLENIKLPVSLHSIVSFTSIKEFGSFWLSIHEKFIEQNTMLTLSHKNQQITYIFSGYLLKETVLLCGCTEPSATEKAMEEIMLINNETANQIRLVEKKVVIHKKVEKKEMNEDFLNDFSTLNNELINSKRKLMAKKQKIESLNNELKNVNETMTMFTYSVSHDLKEPVRMVKSFLTILQRKYGENLDKKGHTYMDMALDGANRINKMIADLLNYHQSSNIDTNELVDMNEILLEVNKILQKKIKANNAQVSWEKLPIIKGSATGLLQVFQNLISNAIKFVPKGKIPIISIHSKEDDTKFTFMVKDNGIGIPENQIHTVFQLFKRLNSGQEFEGTGMGLAMVKKSVERMGGEVWLESELGEGSTFYFTIKKH